jgi:hypothetical protein
LTLNPSATRQKSNPLMALDLSNYEQTARDAVRAFWGNPHDLLSKLSPADLATPEDFYSRKHGMSMLGFLKLLIDITVANGLGDAEIHRKNGSLTLPGFFRPTKLWDLLVIHRGQLVAAIDLKSQKGPSFGNNFNSRIEQAIGNAHDFWTAYREGVFGKQPRPFIGWMILVEDSAESHASIKDKSPHFPIGEEFRNISYLRRYDRFCQKLVTEQLYSAATVISSPKEAYLSGEYSSVTPMTSLKTFVTSFAGHIAAHAARLD